MALPTEKTKPITEMYKTTALLYGPPKIGKSTFCANIPDALFLRTEDGLKALEVFEMPITTWKDFLGACREIAEGKHSFKTIVIDTIDNLFKVCSDFVCEQLKIKHPDELDYGRGYEKINTELFRVLTKLSLLPYGLWFVSHSIDKEVKTRTGKITKTVPTLKNSTATALNKMVDFILYCDFEEAIDTETGEVKETRVIRTKSYSIYDAGDRFNILPDPLPLNYMAFKMAFDCGMKRLHVKSKLTTAQTAPITSTSPTAKPTEKSKESNKIKGEK